jgi:hypothetical protein
MLVHGLDTTDRHGGQSAADAANRHPTPTTAANVHPGQTMALLSEGEWMSRTVADHMVIVRDPKGNITMVGESGKSLTSDNRVMEVMTGNNKITYTTVGGLTATEHPDTGWTTVRDAQGKYIDGQKRDASHHAPHPSAGHGLNAGAPSKWKLEMMSGYPADILANNALIENLTVLEFAAKRLNPDAAADIRNLREKLTHSDTAPQGKPDASSGGGSKSRVVGPGPVLSI